MAASTSNTPDDGAETGQGTPGAAPGAGTEAETGPGTGTADGGRSGGASDAAEQARLTAWVRGQVQGVGFRWFTRACALRIGGLVGFALNLGDGRVQVVAEGARADCEELLEWLRTGDTPGRVDGVTEIWDEPRGGYDGFAIR